MTGGGLFVCKMSDVDSIPRSDGAEIHSLGKGLHALVLEGFDDPVSGLVITDGLDLNGKGFLGSDDGRQVFAWGAFTVSGGWVPGVAGAAGDASGGAAAATGTAAEDGPSVREMVFFTTSERGLTLSARGLYVWIRL